MFSHCVLPVPGVRQRGSDVVTGDRNEGDADPLVDQFADATEVAVGKVKLTGFGKVRGGFGHDRVSRTSFLLSASGRHN